MSSLSVLINIDTLTILKVAPTVKQLEYWADILCPFNDFKIQGHVRRVWSAYSDQEIRHILNNACQSHPPENAKQADLYGYCYAVVDSMPVDDTPVEALKTLLGEAEPPCTTPLGEAGGKTEVLAEDATKARQQHTAAEGGHAGAGGDAPATEPAKPKAPPKKGATKRVWELADQLKDSGAYDLTSKEGLKAFRVALLGLCEQAEINKSTAGTQYSKWKKAQGI